MPYNLIEAEARAEFYADTIEVTPPSRLLDADGAPSDELEVFCRRYGATLDWIFFGDVRGMIDRSYRVARNKIR